MVLTVVVLLIMNNSGSVADVIGGVMIEVMIESRTVVVIIK